jgi:hypothetical protein
MAASDPSSARTEAERLVATALAAVRLGTAGRAGGFGPLGELITGVLGHSGGAPSAAPRPSASRPATPASSMSGPAEAGSTGGSAGSDGSTPGGAFATGAPECCVCPICRAISALRDPSPEFAERLATGAGDFAAGVASLLRALSSAPGPVSHPGPAEHAPTGSAESAAPTGATTPTGTPSSTSTTTGTPPAATGAATSTSTPAGASASADSVAPAARLSPDDEGWRGATRTGHDSWPAPERDVWAAATRAARVPGEPVFAEGDAGDGA